MKLKTMTENNVSEFYLSLVFMCLVFICFLQNQNKYDLLSSPLAVTASVGVVLLSGFVHTLTSTFMHVFSK